MLVAGRLCRVCSLVLRHADTPVLPLREPTISTRADAKAQQRCCALVGLAQLGAARSVAATIMMPANECRVVAR